MGIVLDGDRDLAVPCQKQSYLYHAKHLVASRLSVDGFLGRFDGFGIIPNVSDRLIRSFQYPHSCIKVPPFRAFMTALTDLVSLRQIALRGSLCGSGLGAWNPMQSSGSIEEHTSRDSGGTAEHTINHLQGLADRLLALRAPLSERAVLTAGRPLHRVKTHPCAPFCAVRGLVTAVPSSLRYEHVSHEQCWRPSGCGRAFHTTHGSGR